jgi:putative membrane protein
MMDEDNRDNRDRGSNNSMNRLMSEGWLAHIVRFVVAAIVIMVVSYITPGFSRLGFGYALLAAVLITVIGYALESMFGKSVSPYAHGAVGFIVSAIIFYVIQFLVPGVTITVLGALIAALIVGIIDMFVPTGVR